MFVTECALFTICSFKDSVYNCVRELASIAQNVCMLYHQDKHHTHREFHMNRNQDGLSCLLNRQVLPNTYLQQYRE